MSNKFVTYFTSLDSAQKRELALICRTTPEYLSKQVSLMKRGKNTSLFKPGLCSAIEIFSNKFVTRQDLRPDDWMDIWIELKKPEK